MATTVGSHTIATFTSPVNGTTPIDANTVRGNDNVIQTAYNAHDSDTGIHVQSSTLASRPVAGTAGRKWITADAGSYKLWYDDGTRWHEIGNDAVDIEVIADENLVKGDVVSVTGYNTGQNVARVAKFTGAAPAFGIATETIANGGRGYIINTGLISDVNTNAFGATGTILYPAATGTFTATKPTSGTYQVAAYVLRQGTNNGVLYVEFSAPRIVERSDNTANTLVLRDGSGNVAATAGLFGNGTVGAPALAASADTNTGIYFPAADTLGFVEGGVESMRLDSNGNLGIGTATIAATSARLDVVYGSAGNYRNRIRNTTGGEAFLLFQNSDTGTTTTSGLLVGIFSDEAAYFWNHHNKEIIFGTNNTQRWQISTNGHLIAGTDNTYDIGASGATRPRDVFVGRNVRIAGDTTWGTTSYPYIDTNGIWFDGGYTSSITASSQGAGGSDLLLRAASAGAVTRMRVKAQGQVRFVPLAAAPTTNVEDGDVYYDSGTNKLRVRAAGAWTDLH